MKIGRFVEDLTYEEFVTDDKTASAVLRKLEIIGEAAKQVPVSVKMEHPNLPWAEMARMRDKLIHGYFGVDLEIVWKVIKERLPKLQQEVERIVRDLNKSETMLDE